MMKILKRSFFVVLLMIICIECVLRVLGYTIDVPVNPNTNDAKAFIPDSILCWRMVPGKYVFDCNKAYNYNVTIDGDGNRTSGDSVINHRPSLHLYGCSYTFGYSVTDSQTLGYQLQKLLPEYRVENKGVPGYGLAQMYLALQNSILKNDTPSIAVFNYADFHIYRTIYNKNNTAAMYDEMNNMNKANKDIIRYPYYTINAKNDLELKYCTYNNITHRWNINHYFVTTSLLNNLYFNIYDKRHANYTVSIAQSILKNINDYCSKHDIKVVFANVDKENTVLEKFLLANNINSINYGLQVIAKDGGSSNYNCGPADPWHPSALAYRKFAEMLKNKIK